MTKTVMDEPMLKHQGHFQTAFWALLLAVLLPLTLALFGAVRARQLESRANPRWARFAQVTGPVAHSSEADLSARLLVRTVSRDTEQPMPPAGKQPSIVDPSLTGSVSGYSSLELPFRNDHAFPPLAHPLTESLAEEQLEEPRPRQTITFRPVDEENPLSTLETNRLSMQLTEVQRRLDRLAVDEQQRQLEAAEREQRMLMQFEHLHRSTVSSFVETPLSELVDQEVVATEPEATVDPPATLDVEPTEVLPEPAVSIPTKTTQKLPTDIPELSTSVGPVAKVAEPLPVESNQHRDSDAPLSSPPDADDPAALIEPTEPSAPNVDWSPIRIQKGRHRDGVAETFSLRVHDADVRHVFTRLADAAHVNILLGPSVEGAVSLNLHEVSLEAALKAIVKSRGYSCEREDDIFIVRTSLEADQLSLRDRKRTTRIYQPNYLSAVELERLVKPLLSVDGRHSIATSLPQGASNADQARYDDQSSTREALIVQDMIEVLNEVDRILVDLDVAPLQVSIEAKILSVRLSGALQQGVDLERLHCQRDTGSSHAEGGLKEGKLQCDIPTFIKSIERLADTSLVTSQRIQVLNKHRAEMLIGDRIGYQARPGDPVRFTEAGARLMFRPQISVDGYVRLEIHPERSTATINKRTRLPQQSTSELTTQVMIHDGDTIAIGGLISEQAEEATNRLPLIGSIPVIGFPFRSRHERLQRTELIVLVTPHIVTDPDASTEGRCLDQVGELRATEFKDQQSALSRHHLAKAHYDRACGHLQQGQLVKARQQIEASLRQNKADVEAMNLREEIDHRMGSHSRR